MKYTVYCTGIREGGQTEWEFAYNQYKTSPVASERSKLLSALACTKVPWILERFLEYAITSSEVRKQDGTKVIENVGSNIVGQPIAWNFLRQKWNYIYLDYSDKQWRLSGALSSVASSFNTEFDLKQLRDFGENVDLGGVQRMYKKLIEETQSNIQWMKNNLDIVQNWLDSNVKK
ncbi:hypothetical protein FSP39_002289 [Pinctada imbricata]|uniref:ERAP1-like C-terminal domain-containing protein n=1 Tax=Pinctada imbricata TaxID=66713 RepID=A0AA89CBE9_PINIB|nr:hypothetical protein FSP39_002289 [Pinctada imbricata]